MQLRRKLFVVLSLMAMVPLLFLLFQVVSRVEGDLEKRTGEELQTTLGKMSQEIATLMDNQQAVVQGLAKVPVVRAFGNAVQRGDPEEIDARGLELASFFLNYQSTMPSIQAIRFTDVRGRTLVKVREGHLVPAKYAEKHGPNYVENISGKPFFKWSLTSNSDIVVSDFERGQIPGEVDFCPAMVRYSVPIRDELDSAEGLLTINMWGRRVDDAVQNALGGFPGTAYIAEINPTTPQRDGIYLYNQDPKKRFANQLGTTYRLSNDLGPKLWNRIRDGGITGMVEAPNGRLLFYRKYSPYKDRNTQWLLVVETSRNTVLAPVAALRHWIGYLIAAALVISLLIARWAATRLAGPVHDLAGIIGRYAGGDQSVRYHDTRRDEIGSAGRAFNDLADSMERAKRERQKAEKAVRQSERLAAIGQMAAGIGHEINNPLMNIMSLASLVEQSVPPSEQQTREDLRALQSEGRRCARIVNGILNFARENSPRFERFDMARLVDDTAMLFKHKLDSAGLTLEIHQERPLFVEGDFGQLQQVLVNLLLNAVQASAPDSSIEIHANAVDDMVRLEVVDNGCGLSEDAQSKLFNPFFTTKPEGMGTGLGLSVSYGIIKKHGGTISLENRPEGGVRVQVVLPVHSQPAQTGPEEHPEVRNVG